MKNLRACRRLSCCSMLANDHAGAACLKGVSLGVDLGFDGGFIA